MKSICSSPTSAQEQQEQPEAPVYKQCSFQSCCLVLDAAAIFKMFWSNVTISFQRSPLLTHLTKQLAFTSQSSAFFPTSSSNHVTSQQSKTTEKQSHNVTLCYAFITTLKKKTVKKQFPFVYIIVHIYIDIHIIYYVHIFLHQPISQCQATKYRGQGMYGWRSWIFLHHLGIQVLRS